MRAFVCSGVCACVFDLEMSLVVVEATRGRCASFMILAAMVSEIIGGRTQLSLSSDCHQCIRIASMGTT